MVAAVLASSPLKAGTINLINNDTFSSVTACTNTAGSCTGIVGAASYQEQQSLSGTVDSYFSTIDNSLNSACASGLGCVSNVDVLGNITPVPNINFNFDLIPYEGICASSGTVDCIDLDGTAATNGVDQGALRATVNVTTAGTVVLSSGILGSSGYMCSNAVASGGLTPGTAAPCANGSSAGSGRTTAASVLIVFGNSSCFTGEATVSAYQANANCYTDSVTPGTVNTVSNVTSGSLSVGVGTYYVEYLSETAGNVGDLLTSVNLTETTPTPEPSAMILLGSVLMGLGAAGRWRKRKA